MKNGKSNNRNLMNIKNFKLLMSKNMDILVK